MSLQNAVTISYYIALAQVKIIIFPHKMALLSKLTWQIGCSCVCYKSQTNLYMSSLSCVIGRNVDLIKAAIMFEGILL